MLAHARGCSTVPASYAAYARGCSTVPASYAAHARGCSTVPASYAAVRERNRSLKLRCVLLPMEVHMAQQLIRSTPQRVPYVQT